MVDPKFEREENKLEVKFEIGEKAPLYLWDKIPISDFANNEGLEDEYYNMVDICRFAYEYRDKLDLDEDIVEALRRINSVNMFDEEVVIEKQIETVDGKEMVEETVSPRSLLKQTFCATLLQALFVKQQYLSKPAREMLNDFASMFSDDVHFMIKKLTVLGLELPLPEDTKIVYGAKEWDYIRREYVFGNDREYDNILFVPVNQDWRTEKTIVNIAGIFGDRVNFEKPSEDPSLILREILTGDESSRSVEFVFAAIERYIAYQYFSISCIAEFIKFFLNAENRDKITTILAKQAASLVTDTVEQIFDDPNAKKYIIPLIEDQPLPEFEEPSPHSRNTDHLSFDEHVNSVRHDSQRRMRSIEEMKEEVNNLLFQPLFEIDGL